jgi:aminoglycoside phosphotransferase (APT) family kinase protein
LTPGRIRITFVQWGKDDRRGSGPAEPLRAWVEDRLGDRIGAVRSLHDGESPWWVDLAAPGGATSSVVLRAPSSRIGPELIATNAAALLVAEKHGLTAPRLLAADLDGRAAGVPATLETVISGTSAWPATVSPELLLAAGAALARVHAVALDPQPDLPFRPRPIAVDDFARDRREGRMPTTALLQKADERVQAIKLPATPNVFVHGDVWPGNTVLAGSGVRALIDWKTAGVGDPGVDLGELRKQAAILYDDDAPAYVLAGWERATGTRAEDVPYWDAVAALNTPTEGHSPHVTRRRDRFLEAAIARL